MRLAAVHADSLNAWAFKLGVPADEENLAERVRAALAAKFPGIPVARCRRCGFRSPDVAEVARCPGCGIEMEDTTMQATIQTPAAASTRPAKQPQLPSEAKPVAIAPEPAGPKTVDPVERRRQLERTIEQLNGQAGLIQWDTGAALKEIFDDDLWKGAEEVPASFNEYVIKRFSFTPQTARNYMTIHKVFTRDQAAKLRVTDMRLLAQLPEKDLPEFLVKLLDAPERPTTRDLAAEVKAKRQEANLNTSRNGMDDMAFISARIRKGELIETVEWERGQSRSTKKPMRVARFHIGGVLLMVEDVGDCVHVSVPEDQPGDEDDDEVEDED